MCEGSEVFDDVGGLAVCRLGEGPRLVALHGGPGLDHHNLLPLGRELAEHFEVWLPDLPGHGESPPTKKFPGLGAVADRLGTWLRRPEVSPDVLLGHSLGAWLARELVRRRRVTPRALVLVAPPALGQRGEASAVRRAAALTREELPELPPAERDLRRDLRRELYAYFRAETRGRATEEFVAAVRRTKGRPPWGYRALLRNLHKSLTGPLRPFDPECPALVLCGAEDRTTPPDQARRVTAAIEGARLEILSGVGHYPFGEEPGKTAACVVDFLASVGFNGSPGAGR